MPFRIRKAIPLPGPFWLNVSRSGLSWTVKVGRWSWNSRRRTHRVNAPGPVDWESRRGK